MQNAQSTYIIEAAGGNATAIVVLNEAMNREDYSSQGAILMDTTEKFGVEQAGFLVPDDNHFEMSGGEFCGNAARAAALLFSKFNGNARSCVFTMSGYTGPVEGTVEWADEDNANVTVHFASLPVEVQKLTVNGDVPAELVDLGGIVHVLIEAEMPDDYEAQHKAITAELGLQERGAVGVCWIVRKDGRIMLHPVVWVRSIDSFFYETACGSGSIAAAVATGSEKIVQPSGQTILVNRDGSAVTLRSDMEVTHVL